VLYWRATRKLDQPYTVTLQLIGPDGGKAAQQDGWPWEGYFPTSEWAPGKLVADPHLLPLSRSLAPGQYRLLAGMYVLDNGQAKPLPADGGQPVFEVGTLAVS